MSCRKCGSSWKTLRGKDCASCPHCCKLARCKARKNGLWVEPEAVKECVRCGCEFRTVGLHAIAKVKLCVACRPLAQREGRLRYCREYKKKKQAGLIPDRVQRTTPFCKWCKGEIRPGTTRARKYCCTKCFFDARDAGLQQWDRASINEAARKRPSNSSESPWLYVPAEGQRNFASFLWRLKRFTAAATARVRDCKECGRPCQGKDSGHCSEKCLLKHLATVPCVDCKELFHRDGKRKAKRCQRCVRRRSSRRRNRLVSNHRKRCRKNGVPFDPSIKSKDVFARDNYVCHICKKKTLLVFTKRGRVVDPRSPTLDHHPYPLSAGVLGHTWDNVRCACFDCNWKKGAQWSGQLPLPLGCDSVTG